MKHINKFDTTEEFNQAIGGGGQLSDLEHFVALTKDNQMVHLKPQFKGLIINTNNTGTTIYKRTDNQNGYEKITLKNGENKLTYWNYGFYFYDNMNQDQITSFDLSKYDTSNVTNMYRMFYDCSGLTSLDVSKFDTSNVTDMSQMFYDCSGLTSLDVSNFDTSKVTDMSYMFNSCNSLTSLDLSNFDTSMVTDMDSMFRDCSGLTTLDLSNFDTSKVTDILLMFAGCSSLTSLDLSNFDTSKITHKLSMGNMFNNCNKLTHIKCKQAFKNWCITNQTNISLPTAMVNGTVGGVGSGSNWEIIDYQP